MPHLGHKNHFPIHLPLHLHFAFAFAFVFVLAFAFAFPLLHLPSEIDKLRFNSGIQEINATFSA